jgi:hypothetical protein
MNFAKQSSTNHRRELGAADEGGGVKKSRRRRNSAMMIQALFRGKEGRKQVKAKQAKEATPATAKVRSAPGKKAAASARIDLFWGDGGGGRGGRGGGGDEDGNSSITSTPSSFTDEDASGTGPIPSSGRIGTIPEPAVVLSEGHFASTVGAELRTLSATLTREQDRLAQGMRAGACDGAG